MTTITISRQLGSMGCEVAQEVARCLNYRVVWREIINQAALRAGVPEVALHAIDELGLLGFRPSSEDLQAYHRALRQVVEELADAGNVIIVGRAGQAILHGRPDVFHVRVIAPASIRIERLMKDHNITLEAARAQVEASDRSRRSFVRRYYKADWSSPELYDLVINTARIMPPAAAELVCVMLKRASESSEQTTPTDFCID